MLRILRQFHVLMNQAGGNNGGQQGAGGSASGQGAGAGQGGAAGDGGVLFSEGGQAGAGTGAGGAGNGGAGAANAGAGAGNGGNTNNGGGQSNQKVTIPENWQEALPDDLRALPQAQKYKTVPELVKAYAHLEKTLGADRIMVPQRGTPLEQLKETFEKLGVPKDLKDYNVELAQGTEVDQEFFDAFKQTAHSVGLLPQQAKAVTEWFAKVNNDAQQAQMLAEQTQAQTELKGLQTTWGDQWNENVAQAKAALKEFADADTQKFIRESGLGSNPAILKMLAKMGSTLSEAKIKGEGGAGKPGFTPKQAQEKINQINQNPHHPYWDPKHAEHMNAANDMKELFAAAYPNKNPIAPTVEQPAAQQQVGSFNFKM